MANAKYDLELKKEVIDAIVNGGRSSAQAARDYELPVTVTSLEPRWLKRSE